MVFGKGGIFIGLRSSFNGSRGKMFSYKIEVLVFEIGDRVGRGL